MAVVAGFDIRCSSKTTVVIGYQRSRKLFLCKFGCVVFYIVVSVENGIMSVVSLRNEVKKKFNIVIFFQHELE